MSKDDWSAAIMTLTVVLLGIGLTACMLVEKKKSQEQNTEE